MINTPTAEGKWIALEDALGKIVKDLKVMAAAQVDTYMLGHFHGSIDAMESILDTMKDLK